MIMKHYYRNLWSADRISRAPVDPATVLPMLNEQALAACLGAIDVRQLMADDFAAEWTFGRVRACDPALRYKLTKLPAYLADGTR
jgi:hypothetical protein